ncbi:hypothetical protein [Xanthobacter autotrophicus]|uniref:hypothetical protein n=1 Tax=Xanthobacter autotrophicus TaxID=280 RepID=UPI00372B5C05
MNNAIRIEAARAALARAAWVRGDVPCYGDEAVIDLLADIRHLCVVAHIDFEACDRLAAIHFADEIGGVP